MGQHAHWLIGSHGKDGEETMIRDLANTIGQWSPVPWSKHLLMGALAFLLAAIERYGEFCAEYGAFSAEVDRKLGGKGLPDLGE